MRRVQKTRIRALRSVLLAAGCIALAACSSVGPDDPNRNTANPGLGTKLLLGTTNPTPLTTPTDTSINRDCPPIEVLDGAAAYRAFDVPGSTDPFSLRYQASLAETARECSSLGVEVAIRVGVVGRVIIGPKGAPGVFRVPLRVAVVDEANKPLFSEVYMAEVTVPPGQASADFTKIADNITAPIPANRFRGWRILVGYDPTPPAAEAKARRSRG